MDNLHALRKHWGLFCREDLKIIICAPPKCGSTSIFNTLSAVGLSEKVDLSKYNNTKEYLHELKIHQYVRDILPGVEELSSYFADSSFLKVLVIRDPLERLVSAVLSKYLVPNSHFFKEISDFDLDIPLVYESPENFSVAFNEVVRALILKGLSSESRLGSHVDPIARRYNNYVRSCFDVTIDISRGSNGFSVLHEILGDHIKKLSGIDLPPFKRLNESPLKTNVKLLNRENVEKSTVYFEEDYRSFPFSPPAVSDWVQELPDVGDLRQLNMFVGLVSRFSEVYNRSSELEDLIKEKNKQNVELKQHVNNTIAEKEAAQTTIKGLTQQLEHASALLTEKQSELNTVSEEAELTLLQLHQLQEEKEKNKQNVELKQHVNNTIAEKEAAQTTIKGLTQQLEHASALLTEKQSELNTVSEEAELTLLQLHQLQEELEYYFCQSRSKEELLQKHQNQQQRIITIMSKILF